MNQDTKRPFTVDELKEKLHEQIDFLRRSADAYDDGFEDEAIRLAATIRILLYDSGSSKSLLGQLNMMNLDFYDSATDYDPQNRLAHHGLVCIAFTDSGPRYSAMLDDTPQDMKRVHFKEWWNKVVFADQQSRILTRQRLVLIAANEAGGAHVDPKLNEMYAAISKEGALGWMVEDRTMKRPLEWPERAAIRQIAHEVLRSLVPGYSKKPKKTSSLIVGDISITPFPTMTQPSAPGRKIGRNEPCPCGSNIKYKKCHGK